MSSKTYEVAVTGANTFADNLAHAIRIAERFQRAFIYEHDGANTRLIGKRRYGSWIIKPAIDC